MFALAFIFLGLAATLSRAAAPEIRLAIASPEQASALEKLAAREVRRYLYLRTGQLVPLVEGQSSAAIVVGNKDRPMVLAAADESTRSALATLQAQQYLIRGLTTTTGSMVLLAGGDDVGTLYAAYRFAEHLGVRFYLHGDVLPDKPLAFSATNTPAAALALTPDLTRLNEVGRPLFVRRGLLPFHDFPEGPDWWNRDDYLAIISQLPKLRLNFIGLHTYSENRPNAEPTVWIGQASDIGPNGEVTFAYPSSYQNTARGNWGYVPKKTSGYSFGASQLFDSDDFGPDVMAGYLPQPNTAQGNIDVFNRTADLLRAAFEQARHLGMQTCVGTETPLVVPKLVIERLRATGKDPTNAVVRQELYEGIFRRAAQAYPLDYYWLWTPETLLSERLTGGPRFNPTTEDLLAAVAAHQKVRPPFNLATCGWVLGPPQDRLLFDKLLPKDVALSCLSREFGSMPIDQAFGHLRDRSKWAIPWMEDDPALTAPQLWVGRMRRDAFDARRYGCDSLLGLHWRTRVLGPTVAAFAQAGWNQDTWTKGVRPGDPLRFLGPVGGRPARSIPPPAIAETIDQPLYQTLRENVTAYYLPASNGPCQVTLKFCELLYQNPGARIFDVRLQGRTVMEKLDVFAKAGRNRAYDVTFNDIMVTNGWVDIEFIARVEFPIIAALAVVGNGFAHKINCGGPTYQDYSADPEQLTYPSTEDFYRDWAGNQFGAEVAMPAAAIFTEIDSRLPRPALWVNGPGGIRPDHRRWQDVRADYAFVEQFAALQSQVRGAGNRARFDDWLNTFRYLRAMGELNCQWGEYVDALTQARMERDPVARTNLARQNLLPLRREKVRLLGAVYDHLLATVSTPGELGTVMNWEQHCLLDLITKPGAELETLLGETLPANAQPPKHYRGPVRVIVPTLRSSITAGERLNLRVLILAEQRPQDAAVYGRQMGQGNFTKVSLANIARGVYTAQLTNGTDDIEYYVKVIPAQGEPVYFPPTAPLLNQTVVRMTR